MIDAGSANRGLRWLRNQKLTKTDNTRIGSAVLNPGSLTDQQSQLVGGAPQRGSVALWRCARARPPARHAAAAGALSFRALARSTCVSLQSAWPAWIESVRDALGWRLRHRPSPHMSLRKRHAKYEKNSHLLRTRVTGRRIFMDCVANVSHSEAGCCEHLKSPGEGAGD